MTYQSNLPAVTARLQRAIDGGLIAAAAIVENEVKRRLIGGYTSGKFVTGHVRASVTHAEPDGPPDARFILVGTDVMYALFWEVGHHNTWSRKFERVEVWMPALLETRVEQLAAFERVFARVMQQGGGGGGFGQRAASPRSPQ